MISDAKLAHLRSVVDRPDVTGTRYDLVDSPELSGPIGRGGMGVVWRARDRQLERDVALKVLAEPDAEIAQQLAVRLLQEAKVLARLEHPGIVPVHDVGMLPDGRAFYAMKLVRGRRLDELARGGLAEAERFRIAARIFETVAFAHANAVLHRDLKPANVMVGEFGEVLLLDWGLAKLKAPLRDGAGGAIKTFGKTSGTTPGTEHGTRVGTPGFMAPEQERGERDVDARADVFSLGVLLRSLWNDAPLPRPLAAIAAKATAPRADDRYATVQELAADVARFQAGEAVTALREGPIALLARLYRKHRPWIWLIAAYLVARVAFWWWQARPAG